MLDKINELLNITQNTHLKPIHHPLARKSNGSSFVFYLPMQI